MRFFIREMRHGQFLSIISAFSLSVPNADFKFAAFLYKMWDILLWHILSTNLVSINFSTTALKRVSIRKKLVLRNLLYSRITLKNCIWYTTITFNDFIPHTAQIVCIQTSCAVCFRLCNNHTYSTSWQHTIYLYSMLHTLH